MQAKVRGQAPTAYVTPRETRFSRSKSTSRAISAVYEFDRATGKCGCDIKTRDGNKPTAGFTWNRMGDRGYREHSAGISSCHSAQRKKSWTRGARASIDADVRRLPHSAPTSKLGVYTWQSRHFGVSTRSPGFYFRTGPAGEPRDDVRSRLHEARSVGGALQTNSRRAVGLFINNSLIRQSAEISRDCDYFKVIT